MRMVCLSVIKNFARTESEFLHTNKFCCAFSLAIFPFLYRFITPILFSLFSRTVLLIPASSTIWPHLQTAHGILWIRCQTDHNYCQCGNGDIFTDRSCKWSHVQKIHISASSTSWKSFRICGYFSIGILRIIRSVFDMLLLHLR